ncbi:hypothetical protein [Mucisphaera calidilacus]|uniref:Uncharacterized protein n=1 Tax=Mucisphaera calidilacus TaxID=2527982 RepID=A0A518BXA1_9BACT|nr:hypothetical protein [Mucisphaera calidilacus]QDU71603.1 hypothetical protein Pan265_14550 [Mucisphaera calidilacus]
MNTRHIIVVLSLSAALVLPGCSLFERRGVETTDRSIASGGMHGGHYNGRLDGGPVAQADPLPSWTVTNVETKQRHVTVIDPETGLFVRRAVKQQVVTEEPWLAAPVTVPETGEKKHRKDRRDGRPGGGD